MICKTKATLRCQTLSCCPCNRKPVIQTLMYSFYLLSLNSWWFDDFLIHCKDSFTWKQMMIHRWLGWWCARKQWLYDLLCQIEAVRSRMKTDRENHTAKLVYPNWNGTVQYLAVSTTLQSALLWDLSIQGGSGDAGSENFYLYIN